jgi:mono/diheme cytochrome c family protein
MHNHRILYLVVVGIALITGFGAMTYPFTGSKTDLAPDENTPIGDVLKKLGKSNASELKTIKGASVEKGRDLVHKGYAIGPDGKRTKQQSKFYVCTTCHNVVKEFEDPSLISAEMRLDFAMKNKVPFLQASGFYGIVNRTSFYNDDYQVKYKGVDGIEAANKDLRAAIQFCSKTCSQGRELADWEIESILAYFWTLQFKMGDLKLNEAQKKQIDLAFSDGKDKESAAKILETKYAAAMPAHILKIPKFVAPDESEYKNKQKLKEGKAIYDQGCLHCHLNKKYSFFGLDNEYLTFKAMEKATRKENYILSMNFLVREGLPPRMGNHSYMPEFTAEKMSPEQLKNLYLYVSAQAKGKYKE